MKKYLIFAILVGIVAAGFGFYMYNKPHKNIESSKVDFKMEAKTLFAEFEENEAAANTKYLDKIVEVSGIVKAVNSEDGETSIMLETGNEMSGVNCSLDNLTKHKRVTFTIGEKVSFKGLCTGVLMDVVIVRCVEVEKK